MRGWLLRSGLIVLALLEFLNAFASEPKPTRSLLITGREVCCLILPSQGSTEMRIDLRFTRIAAKSFKRMTSRLGTETMVTVLTPHNGPVTRNFLLCA